jgi:serine protease
MAMLFPGVRPALAAVLALAPGLMSGTAEARGQDAIRAVANPAHAKIPPGYSQLIVHVKFREGTAIRLEPKGFVSATGADLAALQAVLGAYPGTRIEPLFSRPPQLLALEKETLERRSGRTLADKTLYYRMRLAEPAGLAKLIDDLNALDIVQRAYAEPLPMPPPVTPDFTDLQGYLDPAPSGIDATIADEVCGARGENVRVIDIEYSWNQSHEDLSKAPGALIPNQTPADPFGDNNHGTAVLGEFIADANGFGVTGIVHEAQLGLVNANNAEDGYDLQDSIDIACANLTTGDVLLIEQQIAGPNGCDNGVSGCVAVEWVEDYYDAIVACTAADIIVVEAAGNGAEDLDDAGTYGSPFPDGRADSGAIIVGSGGVDGCVFPERSRRMSSTFGTRVNVQGWGECVTTTGYGTLQGGGDPNLWYSDTFSGTSSASPIVAAAAASVSSTYQALGLPFPTPPTVVRSLLESTGTPQNFDPGTLPGHIGPLPDLLAALGSLEVVPPVPTCPAPISAECASPDGTPVEFVVTATDDCDSNPEVACSPPSGDPFPLGTTPVSCTATDEVGNEGQCSFDVVIVDTGDPQITVQHDPKTLWPPRHNLVEINTSVLVEDTCDGAAGFVLTSITSNEPDNGLGDGDQPNDIQGAAFGTPDTTFLLRAERSGRGDGRVYTIVYTATDGSGNSTSTSVEVIVPKNGGSGMP